MCGVFGILPRDPRSTPNEASLRSSLGALEHRGPDALGLCLRPGLGLAHTRLALVDPDPRSNQPFWDATGRYALVYNGEIYNFRELRSDLEGRGITFRTTSDTEVVLQCLVNDGLKEALGRFDGMFAFAFYDSAEETLVAARDRFGMKPLYYCEGNGFFAVASEVKAFRPWIPFEAEPFSVVSYLLGFGGPTKGFTFYKGVQALPPGSVIVARRSSPPVLDTFATLTDFVNRDDIEVLNRLTPRAAVDQTEQLLVDSVSRQMFADSRVGAFCSGGVDSSLLVAMAAKAHNNLAIFHSNIAGPWSEVSAARRLSKHLGLELNVVDVTDQDFLTHLPEAMRQYEHPYTYHPNCVPFMLVARLVRQHQVKGMLSGEGADELFLGYPWLGRQRLVDAYYAQGSRLRRLVRSIPGVGRILWPHDGTGARIVETILNRGETANDERAIREAVSKLAPARLDWGQETSLSYLHYHLRTLLHRNDSMGMEAGIEARFPFLDHAVVRTALNMPVRYKLRYSPTTLEKAHPFVRDKWVLRQVASRWIPRSLSQRIKIGFWTTVFQRMVVPDEYFQSSFVQDLFGLSSNQLRSLIEPAEQDLKMRLLHLDVWADVCLHEQPAHEIADKLARHIVIRPE